MNEQANVKNGKVRRLAPLLVCFLLVLVAFGIYGQTLHSGFISLDDDEYVYRNPPVLGGISLSGIVWAFTQVHSANWHPLTWISLMLDAQLYGLWPGGYHLTNLLLHAAAACALFFFLCELTGTLWVSAAIALIWEAHPLRVESVAWVSERKDVLSGLFLFLALYGYLRCFKGGRQRTWFAMVTAFFLLGLLSKPSVVTLPALLLLLDIWPLQRVNCLRDWAGRVAEKWLLILLSAGACLITIFAQHRAGAMANVSFGARLSNAVSSYLIYITQLFVPRDLALMYPYPEHSLPLAITISAVLGLGIVTVFAWILRKRAPYLGVGWLWHLVTLLPMIGLVQVGSQAHADRYTYISHVGLLLAVALACERLLPKRVALGTGVAIASIVILGGIQQAAFWRDDAVLWRHCVLVNPRSAPAHLHLGGALKQRGDLDGASAEFRDALKIEPGNFLAEYALGNVRMGQGKLDDAVVHYRKAATLNPGLAEAELSQGDALMQLGRTPEALQHFKAAVKLSPESAQTHSALLNGLLQSGQTQAAIDYGKRVLAKGIENAELDYRLGTALLQAQNVDGAILVLTRSAVLDPANADAQTNLTLAFLAKGDATQALVHADKLVKIRATDSHAWLVRARVMMQLGRNREALGSLQKASSLPGDALRANIELAKFLASCSDAEILNRGEALRIAQATVDRDAHNPAALECLAFVQAQDGKCEQALKTIMLAEAEAAKQGMPEVLGRLRAAADEYRSRLNKAE